MIVRKAEIKICGASAHHAVALWMQRDSMGSFNQYNGLAALNHPGFNSLRSSLGHEGKCNRGINARGWG